MKPLIVTTPRTGSTLICELLCNIYNLDSNLNEFFSVTEYGYNTYYIENGIVKCPKHAIKTDTSLWLSKKEEIEKRVYVLLEYPAKYMIKIMSHELRYDQVHNYIKSYDIIFLERQNIINQILSYCAIMSTTPHGGIFHHTLNTPTIQKFFFNQKNAIHILHTIKSYRNFKKRFTNPFTIYYEDFLTYGSNVTALKLLMGIDNDTVNSVAPTTVKTKYSSDNLEDLIINQHDWKFFKNTYGNFINQKIC